MSVDQALARVRETALALPGAAERLSHGAPGFHIEGGRFFAYFSHDLHGSGEPSVVVKTTGVDEQAMLIEADPEMYYRPPYLGPGGWIAIRLSGEPDWTLVDDRIARSWELVAPRRLLEAGGR